MRRVTISAPLPRVSDEADARGWRWAAEDRVVGRARSHRKVMDTSAPSPTVMLVVVVVVVVVMVARVAFNTYRMCTGNTRSGGKERGQRSPAADRLVRLAHRTVLFLSRSVYLSLSFSSLVFLAASSSLPPGSLLLSPAYTCTPFAMQLRTVLRTASGVIRRIRHVGVTYRYT